MLQIIALILLTVGATLGVSGLSFWGLDLAIGASLTGSVIIAAASILSGRSLIWGLITAGLGSLALALHLCLLLGWL